MTSWHNSTPSRALKRRVPLNDPALLERLSRYLGVRRPAKAPLFAITPQGVAYRIARWARDVDLPFRPTPNTFRHSFAIHCVIHRVPPSVLQQWLGHRLLQSTEAYTKVLGQDTAPFMRHITWRTDPRYPAP